MAGRGSQGPSIPDWQRRSRSASPDQPSSAASAQSSQDAPDTASRATLLEQAARFLRDEAVRDAPTDRKIAFLESKGLRSDEIQKLLGVTRNAEATSQEKRDDQTPSPTPSESSSEASSSSSETPSSSSTSSSQNAPTPASSSSSSSSTSSSATTTTTTTATSRDVPPIITYPEFLLKPASPPPLFTFRSILYTLYGAAGLAASIYGASEFLVKPMLSTLTSARHELAQTAQRNLKKLNEKLEQNVSTIPPYPVASRTAAAKNNNNNNNNASDLDDSDSVTSDPTELFHRDIATQTTPDLLYRGTSTPSYAYSSTTDADSDSSNNDPIKTVAGHTRRLDIIRSHLREFLDAETQAAVSDDIVKDRLSELQAYLDSLTYSGSSYLSSSFYNNFYGYGAAGAGFGNYSNSVVGAMTGMGKGEENAINNLKAEIRSLKGALLSAKNFPAVRGARMPVPGVGR
ncbi:putative peroxisomal membrane anchor protein [Thermoascus aurantiacus ATCC 26904]